jgi:hypothetical protein
MLRTVWTLQIGEYSFRCVRAAECATDFHVEMKTGSRYEIVPGAKGTDPAELLRKVASSESVESLLASARGCDS